VSSRKHVQRRVSSRGEAVRLIQERRASFQWFRDHLESVVPRIGWTDKERQASIPPTSSDYGLGFAQSRSIGATELGQVDLDADAFILASSGPWRPGVTLSGRRGLWTER
jgi:hypothetical protein